MKDSLQLTPSEVELLKSNLGDESILFGHLARKLTNESVAMLPVLEQIFTRALQANQAVGNFIFQVQEGRSSFGLRSKRQLLVRLNGSQFAWPEPSLEASLHTLVRSLSTEEGIVSFSELINGWFAESAVRHFQAVLRWVYEALADRGWVQRKTEQRLNLFRLVSYEIPARTKKILQESMRSPIEIIPEHGQTSQQAADAIIALELEKELRRLRLSS